MKPLKPMLNVLFIGNSFTARNNLPDMIAQLAAARGETLNHRLISAGGATLRTPWNAGVAAEAIKTDGYDFVVLQEQSTLPVGAFSLNAVRLFKVPVFQQATVGISGLCTLASTPVNEVRKLLPDEWKAADAKDA